MIVRFFDNTRPAVGLLLFLFLLSTSIFSSFFYFTNVDFRNAYPIVYNLESLGPIATTVISTSLMLFIGALVNFIVQKNTITRANFFSLFFFVLLVISNPAISLLNPVLVSSLFVVLALNSLLSLHEHKFMKQKLFNVGLLIGIASIIYPYSILYGVLIFLGIIIYGADSWRKWFIPILAISLPYYILFAWYFWFDSLDYFWDTFFIKSFEIGESVFNKSPRVAALWVIFAILTLISIFDYSKTMSLHKLETRKSYSMTYLSLFVGIIIVLVGTVSNGQELILLFFPISIIWAKFLQHQKKEKFRILFVLVVMFASITSFFIHI
jgi:hypothetical protein